jgi:creatinine amidohydrolase
MRLAELTSARLEELREQRPVALWPVGALEPHGPHAPLGTDTLISVGMCERAAARLADPPAVVLPPLPYGVTRYGAAFAGAIGIAEATLRAVVRDVAAAVAAQGFRRLVIVNNHFEPEQVATLRDAAAEVGALYLDLVRRRNAQRLGDEFRRGSCHAGRYETSLVLADAPQLVDRETMAALPAVEVDMPSAIAAGRTDFVAMGMARAYCGAPADATAGEGSATFETLTDMLVELVREAA